MSDAGGTFAQSLVTSPKKFRGNEKHARVASDRCTALSSVNLLAKLKSLSNALCACAGDGIESSPAAHGERRLTFRILPSVLLAVPFVHVVIHDSGDELPIISNSQSHVLLLVFAGVSRLSQGRIRRK
jgi:hypothetical protein